MKIELLPVVKREQLTSTVYVLHLRSRYIADNIQPGQFINIKVQQGNYPLLRRPFSVAYKQEDTISIIFDVIGEGTHILSTKKPGDIVDVLGPLGNPFTLPGLGAMPVLVAGGLGMAPMPLLTQTLADLGISDVRTFLGARSKDYLIDYKLKNVHYATEDKSKGFHGTVVALLDAWLDTVEMEKVVIYACGPNLMLRALQSILRKRSVEGQVSLECIMACGIGLCQGCPVATANGDRKFKLVCKDGPVFEIHSVMIQ
jgi:dihydroorotate dehydrogenase electron transfer subunit